MLTTVMLPRVARLNFSVLKAQPTKNTAAGINACGSESPASYLHETLRPKLLNGPNRTNNLLAEQQAHLEHLNEADAEEEIRCIAEPERARIQGTNWHNSPAVHWNNRRQA